MIMYIYIHVILSLSLYIYMVPPQMLQVMLVKYKQLMEDNNEYRFMLPDPVDEMTDAEWIQMVLDVVMVFDRSAKITL